MKIKDKETLRSLTLEELKKKVVDSYQEIQSQKLEKYVKSVKNLRKVKMLRKDLAVMKSIIQEKENIHESRK
jgi:ribosomal protein L29